MRHLSLAITFILLSSFAAAAPADPDQEREVSRVSLPVVEQKSFGESDPIEFASGELIWVKGTHPSERPWTGWSLYYRLSLTPASLTRGGPATRASQNMWMGNYHGTCEGTTVYEFHYGFGGGYTSGVNITETPISPGKIRLRVRIAGVSIATTGERVRSSEVWLEGVVDEFVRPPRRVAECRPL